MGGGGTVGAMKQGKQDARVREDEEGIKWE
jgi:hypothetical protein